MKIISVLVVTTCLVTGDSNFDHEFRIEDKMNSVNATNCHLKTKDELSLPAATLVHPPTYGDGSDVASSPNQSLLTEAAKMALNRALFYSFINQKLNATFDFQKQPDLIYDYLSVVSSLTASRDGIVGVGLYYDQNTSYPNWFTSLHFNRTVGLFAPYAMRSHMNDSIKVEDDSIRNYTKSSSTTNHWYNLWLPDLTSALDSIRKETYDLNLTEADNSSIIGFYALNTKYLNSQKRVQFTVPYFDCGRTNKWIVTVAVPVTDYLPRYSNFQHLRRPRFVAVSTVDVDFTKLDINQCPLSKDNPAPNYFADTSFCKLSTVCKPVSGLGFKSGGYECSCKPGYTYQDHNYTTPYKGVDIENTSARYYMNHGFECVRDGTPIVGKRDADVPNTVKMDDNEDLKEIQNRVSRECASAPNKVVDKVIPFSRRLTEHFEPQAREALRFSHFLSSYLQNSFSPGPNSKLKQRHALNQDQMLAEATAIVLSDLQMLTVQMYVNVGLPNGRDDFLKAYVNKILTPGGGFSPFEFDLRSYSFSDQWAEKDLYRLNVNKSVDGLESQSVDVLVKSSPYNAKTLSKMPSWTYEVPSVKSGVWSAPHYHCEMKHWYLTYTLPVVGSSEKVKFSGKVILAMLVPSSLLLVE